MSRVFPALLAALALSAATAHAQDPERHTLRGDRVSIWNLAGRATIEAGSGREVSVEVVRGGADGRRLTVEAAEGRLVVRYPERNIVYRDGRSWQWDVRLSVAGDGTFSSSSYDDDDERDTGRSVRIRSSGSGLEAHADLKIRVPRGQRVTLNLGVGEIEASNVEGELELRTRVSPITTSRTKGRITLRTGSGRISVDGSEGDVNAGTGSGGIEIRGVKGTELRASTGSGSVEVNGAEVERFEASTGSGGVRVESLRADDVRASTGSGSIRLDLTRVPRSTTVRTGSGGATLALPNNPNVEVDVNTGSGGISSDFPVTMDEVRRRQLRGTIGTGADGRIRISTGSGSARLQRR